MQFNAGLLLILGLLIVRFVTLSFIKNNKASAGILLTPSANI